MKSNSYNYILFDLDGTIIDPKEGILNSVKYALKQFNIIETDLKSLERFIGPPLKNSFEQYYDFSPDQARKAIEFYRVFYKKTGINQNLLYDGIIQVFDQLLQKNKTLFIATSKPTIFATQIAESMDFTQYFKKIIGSNLDLTRTSKKEIIHYVMNLEPEIDPSEFIMIGDRSYDILGAQQNGIDSIGVVYGYGSKSEFESCNPTYIAEKISDLAQILI